MLGQHRVFLCIELMKSKAVVPVLGDGPDVVTANSLSSKRRYESCVSAFVLISF